MLSQKRIVLTGATGGIGQALARSLSEKGANLILMGRNRAKLLELNATLGDKHQILVADLNIKAEREQAVAMLESKFVSIDMLINNAGTSCFSLLEDISDERIVEILQSNLSSPILFTKNLLPLLNSVDARIVNIGSTFDSIGYPGFSVYASSKFGLRGFSQSLKRELMDSKVRVQHISPRATKTAINSSAVNRLNEKLGNNVDSPEWVAKKIVAAIEGKKTMMILGWPEKFFVPLNFFAQKIVDRSIHLNLPIIKKHARESYHV